jgi:hypothetical protein
LQRYWYGLLMVAAVCARAQDPFEIHVYEYETLKPLRFTLEQHLNVWAMGSKEFDGTAAPSNDQLHMTYELTGGITKQVSVGFMQLNGVIPGRGFEYAGWRVLPHFYAPKSWHLPLDVGLVAEFSFVQPQFLADTRHVELRPILERTAGAFQLDFNPVFARTLHGPGVRNGWSFEPAARLAYGEKSVRVRPYLEWYAETSPVQVHQLYPGVDLDLGHNIVWSLGVGAGLTSEPPRLVIKSHLEFEFGRHD